MKRVAFVGYASGWGAQVRSTEKGPKAILQSKILNTLNTDWTWQDTLTPIKTAQEAYLPSGSLTLPYIKDVCYRTFLTVKNVLQTQQFPVVIGGDHTVAISTWAGVTHSLNAQQKFGLIWIDAHMDSHTIQTTPSKAYHGMPLAFLLGFGDNSFINILKEKAVLSPQHVCLIGVRSYEEGEAALLKQLGVRIYFIEEVQKRGFKTVLQEALCCVKKETKGFGVSIDLDAFDPQDAPGVGSPEAGGLKAGEVLSVLSVIQNDPGFKALEIVEYNPERDKDKKTLFLIRNLLCNLLPKNKRSTMPPKEDFFRLRRVN